MSHKLEKLPPLERLRKIMAILRSPGGCNWDISQTHKSLLPYLIEEAYEVVEVIESDADGVPGDSLKEELGDLLIQVFFHSRIAEEDNRFDIDQVAERICDKLIHRHPHVFGDKKDLNPDEVRDQWEKIKVESKEKKSVLGGVPKTMPALLLAYRVGEKAGGVGFDWDNPADIFAKIKEEQVEFEQEFEANNPDKMADELGDLIFSMVNLARKLKIDPEAALRKTIKKFIDRFEYIEKSLKAAGKQFSETNLEEMESLWQESKKRLD